MIEYNPKAIEPKWQDYWYSNQLFRAIDFDKKPKYYALIEFPYPSGVGMHVGHVRAYSSMEVIARKRRMEGFNVLFPIGFDAFGLPTENYAIKTKIHPRKVTDDNIKTFIKQLKATGFSFDFDRSIDTTDEHYYRWTQWIFTKMFEHGLAFKNKTFVNFCPSCKVVLANEEAQGGHCDRCGTEVVQMDKDVWFLRITKYAERLLQGLSKVDYLPRIKSEQENWIGKSEGAEVVFTIANTTEQVRVYTTRPDTLFGVTFLVLAPEHELVKTLHDHIQNHEEVEFYQNQALHKTEFERLNLNKDKTGVKLAGVEAINPVNGKKLPVFIADYVLTNYGTGAIMAVPGHDTRDYDFAKKFHLDIIEVIQGGDLSEAAYTDIENGILVNSDFLNGLRVKEAKETMIAYLEKAGIGNKKTQYKMQDWAFNRQRYWGEPIPIITCPEHGQIAVPEKDLPVKLPYIDDFSPSENGESPLAKLESFVNTTCPYGKEPAVRETDTMPQWAGSSWYFLRYCDPKNDKELASYDKLKYWLPVDWYNGGMEHVSRHMIYSRFYNQFLYDIGVTPYEEPYAKRTAQGLILGPDGEKMSKSKGNVVDPLTIIDELGADALRVYILFLGDYEQPTPWNESGVKGSRRFLERVWKLCEKVEMVDTYSPKLVRHIHKAIKDVSNDIETSKFNTAISKLMVLSNELGKQDSITKADYEVLLKLLNPFAPHMVEELWQMLGHSDCIVYESWPVYEEELTYFDEVEIAVQVNGKLRGSFTSMKDASKEELEANALALESVQNHLAGKTIKKVIVVVNKIVNIVAI